MPSRNDWGTFRVGWMVWSRLGVDWRGGVRARWEGMRVATRRGVQTEWRSCFPTPLLYLYLYLYAFVLHFVWNFEECLEV